MQPYVFCQSAIMSEGVRALEEFKWGCSLESLYSLNEMCALCQVKGHVRSQEFPACRTELHLVKGTVQYVFCFLNWVTQHWYLSQVVEYETGDWDLHILLTKALKQGTIRDELCTLFSAVLLIMSTYLLLFSALCAKLWVMELLNPRG